MGEGRAEGLRRLLRFLEGAGGTVGKRPRVEQCLGSKKRRMQGTAQRLASSRDVTLSCQLGGPPDELDTGFAPGESSRREACFSLTTFSHSQPAAVLLLLFFLPVFHLAVSSLSAVPRSPQLVPS